MQFTGADGSFSLLHDGRPRTQHVHLAFPSADDATVRAFHAAALAAGYEDNGGPGERPAYHAGYYGAFSSTPTGTTSRSSTTTGAERCPTKPAHHISADGLAALEAELHALETEGRRAIAERIKTAREWGDLKENSEYHDAKDAQAHLETKILRLRDLRHHAVVVEPGATAAMPSRSAWR